MTAPRLNLHLTDPQWVFLRKEAERLDITLAEVIRRIIDAYREERERKAA